MEGGGQTGACPWWEGVGALPPPLENEKKILPEEILTSFTYVLLMKLGGGAIDTLYMQNERGWADMRLSMVGGGGWVWGGGRRGFAPLENEKKRRISATKCGGGK